MQTNPFLIIGIIHRVEAYFETLLKYIEIRRPEVITLELSYYGLTFREKKGDYYRKILEENIKKMAKNNYGIKNPCIEDIKNFLAIPYEYRVASTYIKKYGGALYLVDMDIFSLIKLKEMEDLISEENLKNLISSEGLNIDRTEVALAKLYFEKGIKAFNYDEEMRVRDEYMCNKILLLMKCYENKSFVHICGWQHLHDPFGIYDKLNPEKVFIYDKVVCI